MFLLVGRTRKLRSFSTAAAQPYLLVREREVTLKSSSERVVTLNLLDPCKLEMVKIPGKTLPTEVAKSLRIGDEENIEPLVGGSQVSGVPGTSSITRQTYGVAQKDMEAPKLMTGHKSLDNPRREIIQAPVRTKSVLSAFFVKQKTPKLKAGYV
ncbi:hypothetical protein DY000_02036076 [Brassica cretica]|uniref:Uncharacterized protein n=1 Tax=Brassica cretica TaxID=69181 RepID=A0ABQ7DTM3_BRACR|nr:hypothetical protein DY000_02036076 [Brassica cretica]